MTRRVGPALAATVLLLAGCAGDGGVASTAPPRGIVQLANGDDYVTGLYEPHVLGALRGEHKAPYLVISGRECAKCGFAKAIFIGSPSDGPLAHREGGPFPGRQFDPETHELLFSSRLFVGRCLDAAHDAAVWFYRSNEKGVWKDGAYTVRIVGDKIVSQDFPDLAAAGGKAPSFERTTALVGVNVCSEIAGQEQALE